MGLDTIELVMDVEETFNIKIADEDAQTLETVGDLYDHVIKNVATAPTGKCLTASAFYDVRAALADCGIQDRFGPSTPLTAVLPRSKRRSFWSNLSRSMGLKLPSLVRPSWVVKLNILATFASSGAAAYWLMGSEHTEILFPLLALPSLFLFGYLAAVATQPLATNYAPSFETFRGLSEQLVAINFKEISAKHGPMGRNDVWAVLRRLIATNLGVDENEVIREANFVRDLGCD